MKKRVWKLLTVAMVAVMLLTGCGSDMMAKNEAAMDRVMSSTSSNAGGALYDGFEYFADADMKVEVEYEMDDSMAPEAPEEQMKETVSGPFTVESTKAGKVISIPVEQFAKYMPNHSEEQITALLVKILDNWFHHMKKMRNDHSR